MQSHKNVGKYQIDLNSLLGEGSFGQVYLGRNTQTGESVAVKVIARKTFVDAYNLKNLETQIEIMKKVSHENIVKLFDVYQTANNMYIVIQHCEEGDLQHYLKHSNKKISESDAKRIIKQIMKGAKYLQTNGIIHRDLKPANILIKEGVCKISDFGFAKNTATNAFLRSIVGTPLYMSPQLLKGTRYTSKSDLWSIGLIYYEMLHGCTPWPANNEVQLLNAIYSRKPVCSRNITDLSRDFIEKCLQINERDRLDWQNAFEHKLLKQFSRDPKDFKSFKPMLTAEKQNVYQNNSQKKQKSVTYIKHLPRVLRNDLSEKALSKLVLMTPTKKQIRPTTPSKSHSVAKFAGSRILSGQNTKEKTPTRFFSRK